MNTWVLGDVHGQYEALKQVISRSGFNYKKDKLIFLGDVIDRGNAPFECIVELMSIENKVLISGNHDAAFVNYLSPAVDANEWLYEAYTLQQWIEADNTIKAIAWEFFNLQVPYFVDEKNRCFIHGGFVPTQKLDDQEVESFLYDRALWQEALRCHPEPLETRERFTEIFIGHTPTVKSGTTLPMLRAGTWNLDTGAGHEAGKLTMMNVETKAYVQSDTVTVQR